MLRRSALKSRPSPQPDGETVVLVIARATNADGAVCCEVCGDIVFGERGYAWSLHTRRGRAGRPDDHTPQNKLLVHGSSNVDACHGEVHSDRGRSQDHGWMIPRNVLPPIDPLTVPVLVNRESRFVYLTADGRYSDTPDGE